MSKRKSTGRLPDKTIAALAMLQSGYNDLALIARSIGISLEEVESIENAEDDRVRRLIRDGLPENFLYRIRRAVKCRRCGGRINLVPCVVCHPT